MNRQRGPVLDANILMRAVLGRRVRELLERCEDWAPFCSPDVCFDDARHYLCQVLEKRHLNVESGLAILKQVSQLVVPIDRSLYGDYERLARERIETSRPGRLARGRRGIDARPADLDRGSRPIWERRPDLGDGSCRAIPQSWPAALTSADWRRNVISPQRSMRKTSPDLAVLCSSRTRYRMS
jgi:hypothetical protein